ncbi:MAG TPA: hypothetical protein VKR54_03440 [Candidatus Babeliales bacterium]|nr:hypothetical protein [Candidatus Babeliales bacterium]
MKKIIGTALIAIMLSATLVDTINAAQPRKVTRTRRTARNIAGRGRVRALPAPTGKTSPNKVALDAKKAERDAQKLKEEAKKVKNAPAEESEVKVVANVKKALGDIKTIEQDLANLRSWTGDIAPGIFGMGYSVADQNKASDIAAPYMREYAIIQERVKANKEKIGQITTKRLFGLRSATINPGKEQEYAQYTAIIKSDEKRLAELEPIIAQQEIIIGKRSSTAMRAAYAGMAATAIALTGYAADVASGGELSKAATTQITNAASTVAYYTPDSLKTAGVYALAKLKAAAEYIPGYSYVFGGNVIKDIASSLTAENVQYWATTFGQPVADTAKSLFSVLVTAGSTILAEEGIKTAYLAAQHTLGNPKATQADAEKALRRLQSAMNDAERNREKAKRLEEGEFKPYKTYRTYKK